MKYLSRLLILLPMLFFVACGTYTQDDRVNVEKNSSIAVESNNVPVTLPDTVITASDRVISIDVLHNDSDKDGDILSIASLTSPTYGTVRVVDGKVIYEPFSNSTTEDSFTYKAYDSKLYSHTTTVRVYVDDLLSISNDNNDETAEYKSKLEFFPHTTHGIELDDHGLWAQGIAYMDNGFYLMSKNIKVKNINGKWKEKYTLFNLYDTKGKSIGNVQVDYPSHGQDLSIKKINENRYYLYSASPKKGKIARFEFNTSNIDFKSITYNDIKLDIKYESDIDLKTNSTAMTSSVSEDKHKIVSAGYIDGGKIKISINNSSDYKLLNSFEFNYSEPDCGFYNQGIAMVGEKIFLLRGHWYAKGSDDNGNEYNRKKIFVFDARNGEILTSYTFSLKNNMDFNKIEPEGLTIIDNNLFVCLPSRTNNGEVKVRLYKLFNIKNINT